jgi:hypothetical protein
VTTVKLQAAMQKAMPQRGGQSQTGGGPTDMAATLAQELGLTESKVAAALETFLPQGGPPAGGTGRAPSEGGEAAPSATPSDTTTS